MCENFGIVVPEALASGTPVITTVGTPWSELNGLEVLSKESVLEGRARGEGIEIGNSINHTP